MLSGVPHVCCTLCGMLRPEGTEHDCRQLQIEQLKQKNAELQTRCNALAQWCIMASVLLGIPPPDGEHL